MTARGRGAEPPRIFAYFLCEQKVSNPLVGAEFVSALSLPCSRLFSCISDSIPMLSADEVQQFIQSDNRHTKLLRFVELTARIAAAQQIVRVL